MNLTLKRTDKMRQVSMVTSMTTHNEEIKEMNSFLRWDRFNRGVKFLGVMTLMLSLMAVILVIMKGG